MLFLLTSTSYAADFFVAPTTAKVDCTQLKMKPGDRLVLKGGPRGKLRIDNCIGDSANRIKIVNDALSTSPVIIKANSSGHAGLNCINCKFINLNGGIAWKGAPKGKIYGIRVIHESGDYDTLVHFGGSSTRFTMSGFEVKGSGLKIGASGVQLNDHEYALSLHPGEWRENIVFENNWVHDIATECFYIGPNFEQGGEDDLRLRNITIRNNRVENCGWEGIQLKSAVEGNNLIYGNYSHYTGLDTNNLVNTGEPGTGGNGSKCIAVNNGQANIFSNDVGHNKNERPCISVYSKNAPLTYGPFKVKIYNNKITQCSGEPINASSVDGAPNVISEIYNNTVIQ